MKILESKLRRIIKEELQLEQGGRHQEWMIEKLEEIKRGLTAVLEIADDPAEVTNQLTREIGDLNQWQKKLEEYFYDRGDHSMEEAGRPHSMRGGRTMADLDKDAKTRETDFLKKKEQGTKK